MLLPLSCRVWPSFTGQASVPWIGPWVYFHILQSWAYDGLANAAYFAVYELCQDRLGDNRRDGRHHPLIHAASGVAATVASDAVLTPMDVVKQRLQLRWSPYSGVRDCVVRMLREDGIKAFYAAYGTTVLTNAPFTVAHFATYEAAKMVLNEIAPENASEERFLVHLTAGGAAGALATAVTTPLDVVKTRLQCQGVCGADTFNSSSICMVMKTIVAKEGPRALMQGLIPRVLFHAPAAAICSNGILVKLLHHDSA